MRMFLGMMGMDFMGFMLYLNLLLYDIGFE